MKTKVAAVVVLALAATAPGCVSAVESVRRAAAADLRCPASAIRTRALGSGAFRADGCGRRGFYVDDAAPRVSSTELPAIRAAHGALASR